MIFSKTVVHGVYILCYLNRQEKGSVVPASVIAEAMGVPPEQAAKILQLLANAGIVTSVRGRRGGYQVAKQPEQITMAELIDVLGPADTTSALGPRPCPALPGDACITFEGLMHVHDKVKDMLRQQSLAPIFAGACSAQGEPCGHHADTETQDRGRGRARSETAV